MIFFTSDTHFGHGSAAAHRGFADRDLMDDFIIEQWNKVVHPGDTVYHLGDLSFRRPEETADILMCLRGQVRLVPGNHDLHRRGKELARLQDILRGWAGEGPRKLQVLDRLHTLRAVYSEIHPIEGIRDVKVRLELCHFPLITWDRGHYGSIHLHGHSHGNLQYPHPNNRILDVGVDSVGYKPISLDEVLARMKDRTYTQVDHHKEHSDTYPQGAVRSL